jgi:hypothetical protein
MRYWACLLTLAMWSWIGNPARAEEPPHLDFVQGLRAKGLPDLALEYLQNLKSRKDLPPEVARQLPLEIAKTGLDVAQLEKDLAKRDRLYEQAREEFTAFLKNTPKSTVAAGASLELARLVGLQAKGQFTRSQREETPAGRKTALEKARALYESAGKLLADATAQVTEQLAKPDLPKGDTKILSRAKAQAELDAGLNLLDLAMAYDDAEALKRGETIKKAIALLEKVGGEDQKNPMYWQAQAWIGRCNIEIDNPKGAEKVIRNVTKETAPAAEPGRRLARSFYLLVVDRDPAVKNPLAVKRKAAEEWLKDYPDATQTPEGCTVRFQLAEAFLGQALAYPKVSQNTPEAQQLYRAAERIFESLERTENEYSEQAHDRKLNIMVTRVESEARDDPSKLRTFQDCYLHAQVEIFHMRKEDKDLPKDAAPNVVKKHEEKRKQRFQNIVASLNRALDFADAKTPAADLADARYTLSFAYLATGDPFRAAIVGEDLARREPRSQRASTAAAYALDAYAQIIGDDERKEAPAKEIEADQKRLQGLALYMEKTWPNDPSTDLARQQLGALAFRSKKYPDAMAYFSRIGPTYGDYTVTQYNLAKAALLAEKEGIKPLTGKPSYQQMAIEALTKIPKLPADASRMTTQIYFYGKLELARLLILTKQYPQLDALANDVFKRFGETHEEDFAEGGRAEVKPFIDALPLFARYGQGESEFKAGHFTQVVTLTDPIVDQIKQNKLGEIKDPQLIQGLLGLALRANVRVGKTKQAKEVLDLLLAKSSDNLQGTAAILGALIQQLQEQIKELRDKGEPAQAELEKTIASFTTFLDELAKQPDKLNQDLIRFLAFGYASLEKHEEAAGLLAKIPEPDGKDEQKVAFYHGVRLMYVRELRMGKQFDKAWEEMKKILNSWGKTSLDAKKEQNHLLEDQEKYAAAARSWNELMSNIRPQLTRNAKLEEQYFDCYYHLVYCLYKNAYKMTDENKKKENIRRAASLLVKLKKSKPDMGGRDLKKKYDNLLENEKSLKEQCEELENASQ